MFLLRIQTLGLIYYLIALGVKSCSWLTSLCISHTHKMVPLLSEQDTTGLDKAIQFYALGMIIFCDFEFYFTTIQREIL